MLVLATVLLIVGVNGYGISDTVAPEELVNILSGTHSRFDLSHGNILPEVSMPWGFNGWAPMTDSTAGSWWFHSDDYSILGIRLTHQPSPWIGDYGQLRFMGSITDPGSVSRFLLPSPTLELGSRCACPVPLRRS
jgi:putative alpha-1,2-mannosidase